LLLCSCWESKQEQERYLRQLEENKRTLEDAKKLEQELNDFNDELYQWLIRHKFHLQDV